MIHPIDRKDTRPTPDFRFIKEARGALTIGNVMVEDNGKWTCEAENAIGYSENARPVKLVVLGEFNSVLPEFLFMCVPVYLLALCSKESFEPFYPPSTPWPHPHKVFRRKNNRTISVVEMNP